MFRLLALLIVLAAPAAAGTYGTQPPPDVASIEVLPGWRQGDVHVAALRIRLAPGWKTYWRAPGDAGIPPVFGWSGSENMRGVRFEWPVPVVFHTNGMRSIGYAGELLLPILVTPTKGGPIRLKGEIALGVCEQVCLPWQLGFDAELPASGAPDPAISAALANRARTAAEAGVAGVSCSVDPIRDGLRLTARMDLPRQGGEEVVVIETATEGVWVSEADSRRDGSRLSAVADLVPPDAKPFPLDRSKLRITVIGAGRAVDIRGCPGG